ncbi:hypothetical protein B7R54_07115 [Subtercola boreus]|uniref:DUF5134 domain-containing protein n=1 Tax=Subtercola boreus TaxID=120213 RepID=A0A3E0VJI3_9MICO|nr:hypothetical protein [Subtercola boreus]RFA09017.1 hypothetical protein B7R54_07115 [Subtercola boreus]TQL53983.1 hypothetical protein FB464_1509 [Subtercola boreus]
MAEILQFGALVPATVGACCTAWPGRSGRVLAAISAAVMLLAMFDQTTRMLGLPPLAWATVLVLLAIASAAALRPAARNVIGRGRPSATSIAHHRAMTLHSSIGLIVMAGLVVLMGSGSSPGSPVGELGMVGMHGGALGSSPHGSLLAPFAIAGSAVFVVYSVVLARALLPPRGRRARLALVEVTCMAASVAGMVAMLVV